MLRSTSPANVRPVSNRLTLLATIVLSTLALAACGGGGGGGSNPPPSSPANPPPPPPPPANTAPTVNAGADQTITLPTASVDLAGSATDAEGNALTYAWTASPATGVTFDSASAAATKVTFTTAGTYTLTLTANDGTNNGTDTVAVVVNAVPILTDIVWPGADTGDENHGWAAVDPVLVGMDATKLKAASDYALTGGGAGLVSRRGRLVHKWGNIDATVDLKSTTKSMGGIALALALDDQKLALNDLAYTKLPGIGMDPTDTTPNQTADVQAIKIFNLATHTAGFDKPSNSKVDILGTLRPVGTVWSYSDGGLNWLADVLTKVHQQDLRTLMNTRVWTPLGIAAQDLVWRDISAGSVRPPVDGITQRELAAGIIANPNAMARVGLLYLRKGEWKGTRIVTEASVALAAKPYPAIAGLAVADETRFPEADENYGLLWWTNAKGQLPGVPTDAYWAWGLGDSLIVVIPSLDIVVARVGTGPNPSPGPYWRSVPVPGTTNLTQVWDGDYAILKDFLTPISQSVTTP